MNATLGLWSILFLVPDAGAFESECRKDASLFGGRANENAYRQSTCAGHDEDFCDEGLEYARGAMYGEHSWLVRQAARQAGVLPLFASPDVFSYYSVDRQVVGSGTGDIPRFSTVEPVRHAVANVIVRGDCDPGFAPCRARPLTLAELAHVPDASHSLSDYLLGNEHCLVDNLPDGSLADIQRCHTFAPHMGSVNSTHFPPQSRSMYRLYHDLALDTAERCAAKAQALDAATNHPLHSDTDQRALVAQSCETEALALEAVAQHFLSDTWSTGHMWQRWGTPLFPEERDEQVAYVTTALFAGLMHGWRSVARAYVPSVDGEAEFFTHDQMCMAGPFDQDDQDEDYVEWRNPGEPVHPGGGDLYLHDCLAREQNADWALATTAGRMAVQNKRMLTCMTLGIAQVYAAGPQTLGTVELRTAALDDTLYPGGDIPNPDDIERCWNPLVTNRSMQLGLRIGKVPLDAPLIGGLVPEALPSVGALAASWSLSDDQVRDVLDRASVQLRVSAEALHHRAKMLGRSDPDGTAVASLDSAQTRTFMGLPRNGDASRLIDNGEVPYLEPRAGLPRRLYAVPVTECARDADCAELSGSYCGAGSVDAAPRCMRPEAALVRAFPEGELDTLCAQNAYFEIDDVIASCTRSAGPDSVACMACIDAVRPTLRNGCPPALAYDERFTEFLYTPMAGGLDNRSQCDVLDAPPAYPIHIPFDTRDAATMNDLATRICRAGRVSDDAIVDLMGKPGFEDDYARCGLGVVEPATYGRGVIDLAVLDDVLYVAGDFYKAGGLYTKDIAAWDGSRWRSAGGGVTGDPLVETSVEVLEVAPDGSRLYAGGFFAEVGGQPAASVASFDGTTWSALGAGLGGTVYDLHAVGNDLYAAGVRSNAQFGIDGFVSRWDGQAWADLGVFTCDNPPVCSQPWVSAVAVFAGQVVAGGTFTSANGAAVNQIAVLDGAAWRRPTYATPNAAGVVALRLDGRVTSMDLDGGGNLYLSGYFD
ncbi:MAG: hypothetical protein AAF602_12585, partial [Myxococcota bacterium]